MYGAGYKFGNHCGVTVAPLPQAARINGIEPFSKYNNLNVRLLDVMKATQNRR